LPDRNSCHRESTFSKENERKKEEKEGNAKGIKGRKRNRGNGHFFLPLYFLSVLLFCK
jgi:hypothetical protein